MATGRPVPHSLPPSCRDSPWRPVSKNFQQLSSRITNGAIDSLYERSISAAVIGGKLLGAGGGGFMLFFVEPEKRADFRAVLSDCLEIPIKFDFDGSKIVVYQPGY